MLVIGCTPRGKYEHGLRLAAGSGEKPNHREILGSDDTRRRAPTIAVLAGVTAESLSSGGGIVIGPLFVTLDMQPGSSACALVTLWAALSGVARRALVERLG